MTDTTTTASTGSETLRAAQVYLMAVFCLAAGIATGYLLRGPASHSAALAVWGQHAAGAVAMGGGPVSVPQANRPKPANHAQLVAGMGAAGGAMSGNMPSLAQMKQMADKQAAPLIAKLKTDPDNSVLLTQVGGIYHGTHQFKEAAAWYGKAAQADPRNAAIRVKLASSLYRAGDVDGAIAQLNDALQYSPNDANALFDLGTMRLQGKLDGKGAVAAWQQLLKTNPQLSDDRKAMVQKLMADVMTTLADEHAKQGARSHDAKPN